MHRVRFTILMSVGLVIEVALIVGLVASSAAKPSQETAVPTAMALPTQPTDDTSVIAPTAPTTGLVASTFGTLPLSFVVNAGQTDPDTRFEVNGLGGTLHFKADEVVLSLPVAAGEQQTSPSPDFDEDLTPSPPAFHLHDIHLRFEGGNSSPEVQGESALPGVVNYFVGNDPSQWRTNIPTYRGIVYNGLYPGIDLTYDGTDGTLKGTYSVAAGANPAAIRWRYEGADGVQVDAATGDLLIDVTGGSTLVERAPTVWQEIEGRQAAVPVSYALTDDGRVGFTLGEYDRAHTLFIDPEIVYSTYLDDTGIHGGTGVGLDADGNIYVAGYRYTSTNDVTAFVKKLNPTGTALLYTSYFGTIEAVFNIVMRLAVDSRGNAYLVGTTRDPNFPTVNAYQSTQGGSRDAFLTKLDPTGSAILYSTYLGGSGDEYAFGVAIDENGNAFIVGHTRSANFPTVAPFQSSLAGFSDVFAAKFDTNTIGAASLMYSTYLGGSHIDEGYGTALDSLGNLYVTGTTYSRDFPVLNALQSALRHGDYSDSFLAKLNASGASLIYSTYLGTPYQDEHDAGYDVLVDADGNSYVTGRARTRAYLKKVNANGSAVVYDLSFGGGFNHTFVYGLAIDPAGNIYLAGANSDYSTYFQLVNSIFDSWWSGIAFATKVSPTGEIVYETILSGQSPSQALDVAVAGDSSIYVTGDSDLGFPLVNPLQTGPKGTFLVQLVEPAIHADLSIAKTNSPDPAGEGLEFTYTLTVLNHTYSTASGVVVIDTLPSTGTFVSATSTKGTCSHVDAIVMCNVGSLNHANPTNTATITIKVISTTIGTISNTATVTGNEIDLNPNNNTTTLQTRVVPIADLAVRKMIDNVGPDEGSTVTYTITVTNTGPADAANVRASDVLPSTLTFSSATASQGSYDSATGLWTVGDLAVNASASLQLRAVVNTGTFRQIISNTVNVFSDMFDDYPYNDSATSNLIVSFADIQVAKTVDDTGPDEGETITFIITATDAGPGSARNVQVRDILASQLTFSSATASKGSYDSATGLWTIGNLAANASATLQISAVVKAGTVGQSISNTAMVNSDNYEMNFANNTASVFMRVAPADVRVSKTVDDTGPDEGDTITYIITVTNAGPATGRNVRATDLLPSTLTFNSAAASQGIYDSATGLWSIGDMASGASATLQLSAVVNMGTFGQQISNTVSVTSNNFDVTTSNNQAVVNIRVSPVDLQVTKTVNDPWPDKGDMITFVITVTNAGPSNARNVRVSDVLPSMLTFVSATPSLGIYNNATGLWTIGDLAINASATLQLQAVVKTQASGLLVNTASAATDSYDTNTFNNTASASVIVAPVDLQVSKNVNNATPDEGETIIYTITVTNAESHIARNVRVYDALHWKLTFVSATATQGSYDGATWTIGDLPGNDSATLQLRARVNVGTIGQQINNRAEAYTDSVDVSNANNAASVNIWISAADLALEKSVSDTRVNEGDTITYTITATNNGPRTAQAVVINDILPPEVTFVSAAASVGSYDSVTGAWTVGDMVAGAVQTLNITATINTGVASQVFVNGATVSHLADGISWNNSAYVGVGVGSTDCSAVTEIPQSECEALAALYNSTNGDHWLNNGSWRVTNTPCSWGGLSCEGGHVTQVYLAGFGLSGVLPPEIGNLTHVDYLSLSANQLTGSIPGEIANLTSLTQLWLDSNQLTGSIPAQLGSLPNLWWVTLDHNQLTGPIPPELGNLSNLYVLGLSDNNLSGTIPAQLGSVSTLVGLMLNDNQLTGPIPPQLGSATALDLLLLHNNRLTGNIPTEFGNLTNLNTLLLHNNALSGEIPASLTNLTDLNVEDYLTPESWPWSGDDEVDFGYNALYSTNQAVIDFLTSKDPDWASTQTIAPWNVQVAAATETTVTLSWTPITYQVDGGRYEVHYATALGGPYTLGGATADKSAVGLNITGLTSNIGYYFKVLTFTPVHGDQQNNVYSDFSPVVFAFTMPNQPPVVTVNQPAIVVNEGEAAANFGTASDLEGTPLTLNATVGVLTKQGGSNWSWSYTPPDGLANLTVTISAYDGVLTSQASFTLTVNNVAPTATLLWARGTFLPGEPVTLTLTNPSDPSPVDAAAGFVYSFDCQSDGQWEVMGSPVPTYDCVYLASGQYNATGQIADQDGGGNPYSVPVNVLEPVRSHHIINDVQVQIDSAAAGAQVTLLVTGEQPDGCIVPVVVQQTIAGNQITVSIYRNLRPDVACIQMRVPYNGTISLGTLSSGDYTVTVNGVEAPPFNVPE